MTANTKETLGWTMVTMGFWVDKDFNGANNLCEDFFKFLETRYSKKVQLDHWWLNTVKMRTSFVKSLFNWAYRKYNQ
ncbi:MAG: hypothetical protein NTY22_08070 [Proteobacteria bacterium]|nr:hypothetical protein [Pseudomonadota bacterium]